MSEAIDNKEKLASEVHESEPEPKTTWKRIRDWLFSAALLFIISSCVDGTVSLISGKNPDKVDCSKMNTDFGKTVCEEDQKTSNDSGKRDCSKITSSSVKTLCEGNQYVSESINAIDPFNFAKIFYLYLGNGEPPRPEAPYSFSQPVPRAIPMLIVFLYRAIPGAIYTSLALASSGWVSIITALIALLFGYAALRSKSNDDENGHKLLSLLLIPLIGGVFIWVLIQLMTLASHLFVNVLNAAEGITAFSVLGSTVWAMFKKTENDSTDKFIKWSKNLIFNKIWSVDHS